jgi:hypothetical protein
MGASFGNRLGRFKGNSTLLKPNGFIGSINKYIANSLTLDSRAGVKEPELFIF